MPGDLTAASWFRRQCILVGGDALVLLESSSGSKDRMRKILFDRVESIVTWKTIPWGRMALFALLLGLPGFLLLGAGEVPAIVGYILCGICLFVEARYLYDRKTTLRIRRAGEDRDIVVIVRPGKLDHVLGRVRDRIEATQAQAMRRAEEREAERVEAASAPPPGGAEEPPA